MSLLEISSMLLEYSRSTNWIFPGCYWNTPETYVNLHSLPIAHTANYIVTDYDPIGEDYAIFGVNGDVNTRDGGDITKGNKFHIDGSMNTMGDLTFGK